MIFFLFIPFSFDKPARGLKIFYQTIQKQQQQGDGEGYWAIKEMLCKVDSILLLQKKPVT